MSAVARKVAPLPDAAEEGSEIIANAAVLWEGQLCALPRPARHHDILHAISAFNPNRPISGAQGFLTNAGRFVEREEAARIALAARQCRTLISPPHLFSEDLW